MLESKCRLAPPPSGSARPWVVDVHVGQEVCVCGTDFAVSGTDVLRPDAFDTTGDGNIDACDTNGDGKLVSFATAE